MSIYGSLWAPSDDDHTDECATWDKSDDESWAFSGKPCDCGQPDAPIGYQGSHILPDARYDSRAGWVDLALIPGHITRDGRDEGDENVPWPYLRLGVNNETVVLTRRHVQQIADELNEWLTRTKNHPDSQTSAPPNRRPT